jgi:quercetin dioxygenase-like cupin family protein
MNCSAKRSHVDLARLAGRRALFYDGCSHKAQEVGMPNDVATLKPGVRVGHSTAKNPVMVEGRRDFFTYRDLDAKAASGGSMRAQLTTAKTGMTQPTGWHYHVCEDQFVYVTRGWVELEFETGELLRCEAGDSVFIPGGMKHNELRTSDDFQVLEISTPGEIGTVTCDNPLGR